MENAEFESSKYRGKSMVRKARWIDCAILAQASFDGECHGGTEPCPRPLSQIPTTQTANGPVEIVDQGGPIREWGI